MIVSSMIVSSDGRLKATHADQNLDKLAFQFFKLFAQYEATLKEHGYFRVEGNGRIVVDWDRFANEVVGVHFRDKTRRQSRICELYA